MRKIQEYQPVMDTSLNIYLHRNIALATKHQA